MPSVSRQERIKARNAWDRAWSRTYSRAVAETLVSVLTLIDRPTIADLLPHVGEHAYDLGDPTRQDVRVGDLIGRPGSGPTVASVVAGLEGLGPEELAVAARLPLEFFLMLDR